MSNHHKPHPMPSFTQFFLSHTLAVAAATVVWSVGCGGCGCNGSNGAGNKDSGVDAQIWEDAAADASGHDAELDGQVDAGPGSDCTIHTLPHEEILPGELYRLPPTGEHKVYSMDWNGTQVAYSGTRCGSDIREEISTLSTVESGKSGRRNRSPQKGASSKAMAIVYTDYGYIRAGDAKRVPFRTCPLQYRNSTTPG